MSEILAPATIPEVAHRTFEGPQGVMHYVTAGEHGSPVLLVHGFPESWWAFHKVIPLLAARHRVVAVDLPGFGDSSVADRDLDSAGVASSLAALLADAAGLGDGPVHVVAQDISGGAVFRLVSQHPELVRSFTAIEMGLAGHGLESLGDPTHGGSWHIGLMAAPGIPEMLLAGRERELLAQWAFPAMTAVTGAIDDRDVSEFARGFAREGGWRGAAALYTSMLSEGEQLRTLAAQHPLPMPTLAIGAGGGSFTLDTVRAVSAHEPTAVHLEGVGHYAAMEAPDAVARALLAFFSTVEG